MILVLKKNVELDDGLSAFELVFQLVSDSTECQQLSPEIP